MDMHQGSTTAHRISSSSDYSDFFDEIHSLNRLTWGSWNFFESAIVDEVVEEMERIHTKKKTSKERFGRFTLDDLPELVRMLEKYDLLNIDSLDSTKKGTEFEKFVEQHLQKQG